MRVRTFQELVGPTGSRLLTAMDTSGGMEETDPLRLSGRLRREYDPDLVAAALSQRDLRRRAARKLGADAARMWFTRDGLEQATRARVADDRAQRLVRQIGGGSAVVELGCGIGADLLAMARAGLRVCGVDLDPLRVALARANLAALGLPGRVDEADATAVDLSAFAAAFADPARRDRAGRVFDPTRGRPDWEFVSALLRGKAVVKTAPGIAHAQVPDGVEAAWTSDDGDLVEAALWGVPLATTRRRATLLPSGATLTEADDPGHAGESEPQAYLLEPDDAVIRAGLVTAVAARTGGALLDRHIAYVTADSPGVTPFARAYRIVDEVPFHERPLRQALRARRIGALAIKKRGVDVVPEVLRKRLALRGSESGTLVMTRVLGAGRAFLVEPVSSRGD
ncbi:MAG: THUMP-like domain-containing protein [Nocardioidaceae bacterium]